MSQAKRQKRYKYVLGNPWDRRRHGQTGNRSGEREVDLGGPVTLKTGGNIDRKYGKKVEIK